MRNAKFVVVAALLIGAVAAVWALQPRGSEILLTDAVARGGEMGGRTMAAVSMTIENAGGPDRLIGVSSPEGMAQLVGVVGQAGAPIPADSAPSLSAEAAHVMLMGLEAPLEDGRLLPLTLEFEGAGPISTKVLVRSAAGAASDDPHAMHGAASIEVGGDAPPAVALVSTPEGDGWRFDLAVTNFRFSPENVDQAHVAGEGHAHLYIDGLKVMRVLSPSVTVGALPRGFHTVTVALFSNDHQQLMVDGQAVADSMDIDAR